MVDHDVLTGLYTRKYALEKFRFLIEQAKRRGSQLVLMFIDIDDFKLVNDNHGHHAGDNVLTEVASSLRSCVRETDIVARIDGDEFIIILPEIKSLQDIHAVAEKIIANVNGDVAVIEDNIRLSLSISIAVFPDDTQDMSTLIKHADDAMYSVKGSGKNSFKYWSPELTQNIIITA
ncbi:MAG: GGDEF domain-containing protein [Psychrobium sp.]|nr:GGDEF domain-containing protein [Psychrobium sp.]